MLSLSGCAIGTAGVKKGDERNMARSIDDLSAGRAIKARMSRAYDFELGKVDVEVAEGIAVLTGNVPTAKDRQEAERIAWSAPNVVQVGNELEIGEGNRGLTRSTQDTVLGSKIRTRMITDKSVKARNINIETYDGKVYLLGVARNSAELERAAYIASTTKGVKEVISYIKIADQPAVTQAASMPVILNRSGLDPNIPMLGAPTTPQSAQRQLPDFLTTAPNGGALPVPSPSVPSQSMPEVDSNAPFFRDPVTGERIILPPGTKTIPYDPNAGGAPYYIDPSNGKKVQIVWTGG